METLYDISWKVSEEEYREYPAYSYSALARFNREGFSKLDKLYDKIESPSLTFGSIVDTLLTEGEESFQRKYEILELPNISDTLVSITKELFNTYNDIYKSLSNIPDDIIASVGASYGYYSNSKFKSYRVKRIKEECSEYYSLLYLSNNKVLIDTQSYKDAIECVQELRTNPFTEMYFKKDNPYESFNRYYQLKFKADYEGIPLKCMADLITVNHDNKVITPCDLKTTSKNEWDFSKSFIDWGYWIQSQLYWYIIRENLNNHPIYKDYVLDYYKFIVINRYNRTPIVWEYPDTIKTDKLIYGKSNQIVCENWRTLVKQLDYYLKNKPKYPQGIKYINNLKEYLNND